MCSLLAGLVDQRMRKLDTEERLRSMVLPDAIAINLGRPAIGDAADIASLKLLRRLWKSDLMREREGYTQRGATP